MKRDFVEALRAAERAREDQSLRQGAAHRISQQILEGRGSKRAALRRRALSLIAVPALAAVALLVFVLSTAGSGSGSGDAAEVMVAEAVGAQTVLPAGTRAVAAEQRLEVTTAQTGAVLEREPAGVRMLQGTARFEVERRTAGEAEVVVLVSHGRIEVLGTQFTITQREDGGEVTLHEGSIRFRADQGREVLLTPGETLKWPLPVVAELTPVPAPLPSRSEEEEKVEDAEPVPPPSAPVAEKRTPRAAPEQTFDVEGLIENVELMRRQGRFEDAVAELQGALKRDLPKGTSERLSYELGAILTWQLRDEARACEVWSAHRARHGTEGRYAAEVTRAERALGCSR